MTDILIRPSGAADVASIVAIYSHHVLHGTATFEITPPGPQEIARRRDAILDAGLPYLVAERDGEVAGYAYAGLYRPRPAYQYTIEDSIYLHPGYLRRGIGAKLLDELVRQCERGGWRQLIAVIGDSGNAASIRLHETAGFRHIGVFQSVGWKFSRWLDTVLMQRQLGPGNGSPAGAAQP